MRTVTLLDTSVASDNLGDGIIVDAIDRILQTLIPDAYIYRVATHEHMSKVSKSLIAESDFSLIAGTNILASNLNEQVIWKINPWDVDKVRNLVLMGCGWMNYMKPPNIYSAWLLKKILSSTWTHSVRDDYTRQKVSALMPNVLNTACPTMWSLTPEHTAKIPRKKAPAVLTTLTFYLNKPEVDLPLLNTLRDHYETVYFWPQQRQDYDYIKSLGWTGFKLVSPSVAAYNDLLQSEDVDFLGTRLHGGIRAMQYFRRALIIAVDNRAKEIGRDTHLPIIARDDFAGMAKWIEGDAETRITLPSDTISQWKAQFQS